MAEREALQNNSLGAEADLWRALGEVLDPEFPISVVDMGLIQSVHREGARVRLELTFTAMGCPAIDMILGDVRSRLLQEPGVEDVNCEIVWDPPWTKARLSEVGKARLRAMGIGV